MKDYILVILLLISMLGFSYFVATYDDVIKLNDNNSSPVEEMYHRQLVVTLDSILDSRYACGITEDDSVYPSIDSLSSIAVPNNK